MHQYQLLTIVHAKSAMLPSAPTASNVTKAILSKDINNIKNIQ